MQAKDKDKVKVHYILKNTGGDVLESSEGSSPVEFTIGKRKLISGFENGVIGMKSGEKKTIIVPENEAYGPRDVTKIFEFKKERAPQGFEPQIGQAIQMNTPDGKSFPVTVIGFTENGFKMDANHSLAGKDLIFDVELLEIIN